MIRSQWPCSGVKNCCAEETRGSREQNMSFCTPSTSRLKYVRRNESFLGGINDGNGQTCPQIVTCHEWISFHFKIEIGFSWYYTFEESPPNKAMFSWTNCKARRWSWKPALRSPGSTWELESYYCLYFRREQYGTKKYARSRRCSPDSFWKHSMGHCDAEVDG